MEVLQNFSRVVRAKVKFKCHFDIPNNLSSFAWRYCGAEETGIPEIGCALISHSPGGDQPGGQQTILYRGSHVFCTCTCVCIYVLHMCIWLCVHVCCDKYNMWEINEIHVFHIDLSNSFFKYVISFNPHRNFGVSFHSLQFLQTNKSACKGYVICSK